MILIFCRFTIVGYDGQEERNGEETFLVQQEPQFLSFSLKDV